MPKIDLLHRSAKNDKRKTAKAARPLRFTEFLFLLCRYLASTLRVYKGLIRVDYIIPADGEPCLLEINTTPGMTGTSFIPQQVRAAGLNITDVMNDIIENEIN